MRKIGVFRTSDGSKVQETLDVSKRAAAKITPDMMLGNREANVAILYGKIIKDVEMKEYARI